jgi:hypothetical protein
MFGISLFESAPAEAKNEIVTKVVDQLKTYLCKASQWIADYKRLQVSGYKMNRYLRMRR